jgi:hypothetical protein
VSSTLKPNVDVQGSFNNDSAINNYLPGFFGAAIPKLQFGEGAINLSSVLSAIRAACLARPGCTPGPPCRSTPT